MGLHGHLNKNIPDGEEIVYRASLSWLPLVLKAAPLLIIASALGGFVYGVVSPLASVIVILVALALIAILFSKKIISILGVDIVVTTEAIRSKRGIIVPQDVRCEPLTKSESSDIDYPSFAGVLFGYGRVTVTGVGGGSAFSFDGVADPQRLCDEIASGHKRAMQPPQRPSRGFEEKQDSTTHCQDDGFDEALNALASSEETMRRVLEKQKRSKE